MVKKLGFKILKISFLFFSVCLVGCTHSDMVEKAEWGQSEDLAEIPEEGLTVLIPVVANGLWEVGLSEPVNWCKVEPLRGSGQAMVEIVIAPNDGSNRSLELILKSAAGLQILRIDQAKHLENWEHVVRGRLEIPRLSGEPECLLIRHEVEYKGEKVPNYSMEYDLGQRHARWVAFAAYDKIAEDRVTRTEAWADDPQVPAAYRTDRSDFNGFDRGHLFASNDRRFCREANEQTFYYSNMSPQLAGFNRNIWQKLEENVKSWMQDSTLRDTLYVVKGGTIGENQILQRTGVHRIAVPRYYFMAILARKKETYRSIAFWLEHKVYSVPYDLQGKALTVDELEIKTGIDFFPGLADSLENKVESVVNTKDWVWTNL